MSKVNAHFGSGECAFPRGMVLILAGAALSACEPSFSLVWSKNFDTPIQDRCILDALSSASVKVNKGVYVSNGERGFPKGVTVTQFGYSAPSGEGYFNLDIARIDRSRTRFYHSFEKAGNRPSRVVIEEVAGLLRSNNEKVAAACGLNFSARDFQGM